MRTSTAGGSRSAASTADLLTFDPEMLVHEDTQPGEGEFPDEWREGSSSLPLSYHFEPGSDDDGVSIEVPLATLNTVEAAAFTWNVPGLRHELVTALIRSLPKQLRVNFVPAPDVARRFLEAVPPGEETLLEALSRYLRSLAGVHVPPEAWDLAKVPAHLRPTFRVVDTDGTEVARGKDLEALKTPLRPAFDRAVQEAAESSGVGATGQRTWTFGTIEPSFTRMRAGHEVHGFPTLVDEGATVGLRVAASAEEQQADHRLGVRRLAAARGAQPDRRPPRGSGQRREAGAGRLAVPERAGAARRLRPRRRRASSSTTAPPCVTSRRSTPWSSQARRDLAGRAREVLHVVLRVLAEWRVVDKALHGRVELPRLPAMTDLRAQLAGLVHPGFVAAAGPTALRDYPRYLRAMQERIDRLGDLGRDRELMARVEPLQQAWQHRVDALPEGRPLPADLRRVRWMLEEYRVSLWAQQLGTDGPVSDARIRKALG